MVIKNNNLSISQKDVYGCDDLKQLAEWADLVREDLEAVKHSIEKDNRKNKLLADLPEETDWLERAHTYMRLQQVLLYSIIGKELRLIAIKKTARRARNASDSLRRRIAKLEKQVIAQQVAVENHNNECYYWKDVVKGLIGHENMQPYYDEVSTLRAENKSSESALQ